MAPHGILNCMYNFIFLSKLNRLFYIGPIIYKNVHKYFIIHGAQHVCVYIQWGVVLYRQTCSIVKLINTLHTA